MDFELTASMMCANYRNLEKEVSIPIPEIMIEKTENYSGKLTLRLAPYVHMQAVIYAQREGISLNQYINNAVVSQNAMMNAVG